MFILDSRLQNDCVELANFPLCRLLLMNDATYPWFILVPRREQVEEIYQLGGADQQQLWRESAILGSWMAKEFRFDKLNIAALGNVVRQLHLHHVGRRVSDPTWPGPVWGQHPAQPYGAAELDNIRKQVSEGLSADLEPC